MLVTFGNKLKSGAVAAGLAAALLATLPARAADPQSDARAVVTSMADAVIATLRAGADKVTREARFREMYRRNFDNAGIAAWAAGRAFAAASPAAKQEYLATFETYVVKAYAAQLTKYKGERLRVDKVEQDGAYTVVISNLVPPDPRDPREIEMRWRLSNAGGRLVVSDVVIDKISMALTEKRAFADWLREKGGTLEGLTQKLKEKIAAVDQAS
jgi:ABC-type transporter MlaC component